MMEYSKEYMEFMFGAEFKASKDKVAKKNINTPTNDEFKKWQQENTDEERS